MNCAISGGTKPADWCRGHGHRNIVCLLVLAGVVVCSIFPEKFSSPTECSALVAAVSLF